MVTPDEDPCVQSVREILSDLNAHGIKVTVMCSSFRPTAQTEALADRDRRTVSPTLLQQLGAGEGTVERRLAKDSFAAFYKVAMDERAFL